MARTTISLPDDLKSEMDALSNPPNWSAIAASAYREILAIRKTNKTEKNMNAVIERMKAAQEVDNQRVEENGREQGRKWAMKHATPRQLERIHKKAVSDAGWDQGGRGYSFGDEVAQAAFGESASWESFDEFIDNEYSEYEDDCDFVAGFIDGAMEVWTEVHDKV